MNSVSRSVTQALTLPETFAFSQSSLQAYEDCPRRFWLAYAEQLPWPAIEATPVAEHEQLMRLGSTFHLLVQRAQIGLDPELLGAGLEPPLGDWFNAYLRHRPADLPNDFFEVERILSMPFGSADSSSLPLNGSAHTGGQTNPIYRLAAKYDLIAADTAGRVVIIDWKTARKRTDPSNLRQRLQTIVYPYVLVEASAKLPWGPIEPEQVEMRYWFTAAPSQPVIFRYDRAQHEANHERLHHMLAEILVGQREVDFPTVADTEINRRRFCGFCVYRSRCNRGVVAGNLDEVADAEDFFTVDADTALEFTLDDVTELAF
ncbi:PD-(D/E)XK nuclease family protein [soil metagenome]